MTSVAGAILVGGRSTRMGKDKARLMLGSKTVLEHVIKAMAKFCDPLVLVGAQPGDYAEIDLPAQPDVFPGTGPLGGIYTALVSSGAPEILIATCDQPFLQARCLTQLLNATESALAVCYSSPQGIQPFPGLYRRASLPLLENALREGSYSVRQWLRRQREKVELITAGPELESCFFNLNTPVDWQRAEQLLQHLATREKQDDD